MLATIALTLGVPTLAAASGTHHHTGTTAATKSYWAKVAAINSQFVAAVKQAKAQLAAALALAKTPGQRSTARAQYTLAIVEATQVRDAALVALGPPPATTSQTTRVARVTGLRVGA
ncbi:MAG TPA: hypothetical protein VGS61_02675 [Acidimicrobiales bacterium]|nr:hypothetical protein [Acidimicrobiales bacterium]